MDKNKHLISRYLGGELDPLSTARFEETLKNDPALRAEMELYKEVEHALADTEILRFRSRLKELHEELMPEIEKLTARTPRRLIRVAVAAGFLLVIGLGTFSILRMGTGSQRLLDKFYRPYDMTMVNRSGNSDMNAIMNMALIHYHNKEYRDAVILFEQLLEKDPSQMATRLYSGISYFEIKEFQKASNSFNQVIQHNDNLYIEQAEWYLGFCFIMRDEKQKAIRQFQKIADGSGYYSDKAKQIVRKLK
jgi:tetratricopeptide (TPR) repeat protein